MFFLSMESKQQFAHTTHNRECQGQCGQQGTWRFLTQEYLCPQCKLLPEFKLITRTTAINKYGLTFQDLHAAHQKQLIRMFTGKNPHGGIYPSHYYYDKEISNLRVQKTQVMI